ncbi:electron transfer flavoprotein subunit beta/FixA family protein [Paenibacillus sp. URB8-2]|uniref:electron transfer flavoprotein subunit beta/FixA family protein n=1 Tax=Paenibacillus sp. URB8-2 TaxID=2741301 RepID=UPI0015B8CD5F|nr:electron transfer flavoprotein subunit beta/FixA family protein [Paenibacillus sp. URB8-2]BCG60406.1 protein FixA [Paenibacillus sp. URB8-2]
MLHIVVCVKQVPDSREIRIDSKTNSLIRQGVPSIVNFYDMHGLEEALRIKDSLGARVTVITMGPPPAEKALKECISLGADEAVLVTDRGFAGADTLATSYVLGAAIHKVESQWGQADLIFCGKQTIDGDTGQVGPGIACRLNVEQLTYVNKIVSLENKEKLIRVQRHLEDGIEIVETKLPVLMTVLKDMNKIRRASLPGMIRGARYKPIVWTAADFPELDRSKMGLKGSPTTVGKTWVPEVKKSSGETISADMPQDISKLALDKIWETKIPQQMGWL